MEAQNRETDKLLRDLIFASALTAPLSVMMWTGKKIRSSPCWF